MPGPGGAAAGDLFVEVDVEEDARFERDGADVVTRVNVSFIDAALGAQIKVPSVESDDSMLELEIPQGTQPGTVFTKAGKGIVRLGSHGRGSLIIVVQVDVPKQISPRAKELLGELDAELRGAVVSGVSGTHADDGRKRAAAAK